MKWVQVFDPVSGILVSALLASIPVFFIFWALIIRRMKGYLASMLTVLAALIVAIAVYGMPVRLAAMSALHGILYGLFPISWILFGALFLYNVTVRSGQFEIIKGSMASITHDRRLQALIIAFSFGAFLEGATGMGTPVAISAAMLVGLGFNPLYAAGLCLIANTAPVAFGAVGTPIIIASQVSGLPEMAISKMVGRTLPLLSLFVPFYLVILMSGFRRSLEVLPAILVSGVSFAVVQWYTSNYMNPMLPDVIAGIVSIICLTALLRFWKPSKIWRFRDEPVNSAATVKAYGISEVVKAWSPFVIMTFVIITWSLQPVKDTLNSLIHLKFSIPGLSGSILNQDGTPLAIKQFDLNILTSPGSAVLLSAFISLPVTGLSLKEGFSVLLTTLKQIKYPVITIISVLAFAFISNYSGMSTTIALALAATGFLFPLFAPLLGWLGVFLTGSDTSSNALFCKLQHTTASAIGVDPLITVSANATGGVTGKMVSPQSIAVGAASVGLVGKEADLLRFTLKHSFIMLAILSVITFLQAYYLKIVVPEYTINEAVVKTGSASGISGNMLLLILAACLVVFAAAVRISTVRNGKKG